MGGEYCSVCASVIVKVSCESKAVSGRGAVFVIGLLL